MRLDAIIMHCMDIYLLILFFIIKLRKQNEIKRIIKCDNLYNLFFVTPWISSWKREKSFFAFLQEFYHFWFYTWSVMMTTESSEIFITLLLSILTPSLSTKDVYFQYWSIKFRNELTWKLFSRSLLPSLHHEFISTFHFHFKPSFPTGRANNAPTTVCCLWP